MSISCKKLRDTGRLSLVEKSIVESIEILDRELDEIKRQAKDGHLKAKVDETVSPKVGEKKRMIKVLS